MVAWLVASAQIPPSSGSYLAKLDKSSGVLGRGNGMVHKQCVLSSLFCLSATVTHHGLSTGKRVLSNL